MIQIEGIIQREIFCRGDFRIYSFVPLDKYKSICPVNKYGNISIQGILPKLFEHEIYKVELEYNENGKYENSYTVNKLIEDNNNLSDNKKDRFLKELVTENQYNSIIKVYPNFVQMVINDEHIDTNLLHGIGEVTLNGIKDKIKENYKYAGIMAEYPEFNMTSNMVKRLYDMYPSEKTLKEKLESNPYECLCKINGVGFKKADGFILKKYPQLLSSEVRAKACLNHILSQNETEGNTWISFTNLYRKLMENAPEIKSELRDLIADNDDVYYDSKTNRVSRKVTYFLEQKIAKQLLEINNRKTIWDIDTTQYNEIDGFSMTDEQKAVLEGLCVNDLCILTGYGGCVDSETEFFDGKGWKKISDYVEGDKVLQYNQDNKMAELVYPQRYIKEPCLYMWNLNSKNLTNQCLTDEHTFVYEKGWGDVRKTTFEEFRLNWQHNSNSFKGKIITNFRYRGNGIDIDEQTLRLMVNVICFGTFLGSSYRCIIKTIKEKRERILGYLPRKKTIYETKGEGTFGFNAPMKLNEFLDLAYDCSKEQQNIIIDEIFKIFPTWRTGGLNISSKRVIDFLQFTFTARGYKATIKTNKSWKKYDKYSLAIGENSRRSLSKSTTIERYKTPDNYKYCFTVSSGMLVLRRDDKIFITGNCGKSWSTKAVIDMLKANGKTFMLLSPTGRASKVLSENTNEEAKTIHRGLGYNPRENTWKYNKNNKIPVDVVIVDEFSMLDAQLLGRLLDGIGDKTKILFIGDSAQIPSVGAGNIATDMLESGVFPIYALTKIFRYDEGGLAYACTKIRNGEFYLDIHKRTQSLGAKRDYAFVNSPQDKYLDCLVTLFKKQLEVSNIDDVMVITSTNVGQYGTFAINKLLQDIYNPHDDNKLEYIYTCKDYSMTFRIGDKVMEVKNNYKEEPFIFNGDIGYIQDIAYKKGKLVVKIDFDGNVKEFVKKDMEQIVLAYAITGHKSQGSQFKHIIMLTPIAHKFMLNRNLLYVIASRGQKSVKHIGDFSVIKSALRKSENLKRNTWLKDILNTLQK